jgi:hypothetical protein
MNPQDRNGGIMPNTAACRAFFTEQRPSKLFKPLQSDFSQQQEIHEVGMLASIHQCILL